MTYDYDGRLVVHDEPVESPAGRTVMRIADAFAGAVALAAAAAVLINIFVFQAGTVRRPDGATTSISVESKPRAVAAPVPNLPAMVFAPNAIGGTPPASAPPSKPVPPPAVLPAATPPDALMPPAALPPAGVLGQKSPSPLVADIQRELARRGLYDGVIDGLSGPRTEAAIRAFEQAARLRIAGEPTEAVLAQLRRAPALAAVNPPAGLPGAPPAATQAVSAPPQQPALSPAAAAARAMLPPAAIPGDASVTGSVRPPGDVQASARILSVQKALARLGYGPLRLDGQPGTETRLAIQRFERDRNLPPNGEITDRLVRELAAVSGAPLD
ncbi:peptidoglycan-binding protein [Aquabacter spiritensis]|uniref:Putative peptidoglycan binding protein n=1 Tax=Aquabacter spiritensis TaxID=933073 RepID=A0A4R3LU83_9HYPH|nr:peptidoglycan-binding domain-containing protein [Aquabacter spiritensis]TCT03546.1 putative peptidoglycan binding protein [Aquabacter spiritensis]